MVQLQQSVAEIAQIGEQIYEQEIRSQVETEHQGEFVIIDVNTGDYEVDPDDPTACQRLLARRPDALLYGVRVGYATAYRLGGASQ